MYLEAECFYMLGISGVALILNFEFINFELKEGVALILNFEFWIEIGRSLNFEFINFEFWINQSSLVWSCGSSRVKSAVNARVVPFCFTLQRYGILEAKSSNSPK